MTRRARPTAHRSDYGRKVRPILPVLPTILETNAKAVDPSGRHLHHHCYETYSGNPSGCRASVRVPPIQRSSRDNRPRHSLARRDSPDTLSSIRGTFVGSHDPSGTLRVALCGSHVAPSGHPWAQRVSSTKPRLEGDFVGASNLSDHRAIGGVFDSHVGIWIEPASQQISRSAGQPVRG